MKLSKQERIFIIIFIVAAIVGVGFFIFVLPNFNQIDVNNKTLATTQKEYADLVKKLEREATIEDDIRAAYEGGKSLADAFYDDLTTYEADEIMRQFIAKGKDIKIDGLDISPFTTETLAISVFNETEVTYPLKDFANTVVTTEEDDKVDIEAMETREQIMYAKKLVATLLSASQPVVVGSIEVSFKAHSDKLENLHAFVDLINDGVYDENIKNADGKPQRKATYMEIVSYEVENKSGELFEKLGGEKKEEEQAPATDPANPTTPAEEDDKDKKDFEMDFSVKFFCIKPVADPFANAQAAQ